MAAKTPTTLYRESIGSLTMHIANFAIGAAPGDTWTSAIPGVVGAFASGQTGTQTGTVVSCTTTSAGVITFGGGVSVTMPAFQCFILSRS
jgi:hypothetical protein